jgi:transcriptional accessory protein Tex/SPT6
VQVTVLEIDLQRKRIALTMRGDSGKAPAENNHSPHQEKTVRKKQNLKSGQSDLAAALEKSGFRVKR